MLTHNDICLHVRAHAHCGKHKPEPRHKEIWERGGEERRADEIFFLKRQRGGRERQGGPREKTRERENTQLGQSYVIPLILMHACT